MTSADELIPKMKWTQVILVFTFILCLTGAAIVSIVSFFQTEGAFKALNDINMPVLGTVISYAFAFIFQYGQNVALYMRSKFCTGKVIFTIPLIGADVTDKQFLLTIFIVFAAVDALTNVIWFYKTVETNPDAFLDIVVKTLGYSAMIISVFVEEVIGRIMDALTKALKELKSILDWEKKNHSSVGNTGKRVETLSSSSVYRPRPVSTKNENSFAPPAKKSIYKPAVESRMNEFNRFSNPTTPKKLPGENYPGDELGRDFYQTQMELGIEK